METSLAAQPLVVRVVIDANDIEILIFASQIVSLTSKAARSRKTVETCPAQPVGVERSPMVPNVTQFGFDNSTIRSGLPKVHYITDPLASGF